MFHVSTAPELDLFPSADNISMLCVADLQMQRTPSPSASVYYLYCLYRKRSLDNRKYFAVGAIGPQILVQDTVKIIPIKNNCLTDGDVNSIGAL